MITEFPSTLMRIRHINIFLSDPVRHMKKKHSELTSICQQRFGIWLKNIFKKYADAKFF
jgi:hypothetical protein